MADMKILCQIKASAGSGKTHTLTSKYLDFLCACQKNRQGQGFGGRLACAHDWASLPASFGDIVAITFTNAAVAEIRERVISRLKKAALSLEAIDGMDMDMAEACLESLLLDLGQMNVRTIDSLLYQIVRSAALGLDLSPDFEPVFDLTQAIGPHLDNFLRQIEAGDKKNTDLLYKVVECFLEAEQNSSSKDKPRIFMLPGSLLESMKPYLLRLLLAEGKGAFPGAEETRKILNETKRRLGEDAAAMLDLVNEMNQTLAKGAKLELSALSKKYLDTLADPDWRKFPDSLVNKPSVKSLFNKKDKITADLTKLEEIYQRLKSGHQLLTGAQSYLKNAPIVEMGAGLVEEYYGNLAHETGFPSELVPVFAARALSLDYGVCDALCRLGTRLTHFMIDEFQDTNLEQWHGLKPIILEALSRGGSFTWVGDIKQSIFMWRGADPRLFDGILKENGFRELAAANELERMPLAMNRRSCKAIVDFNNTLFEKLEEKDYAGEILKFVLGEKFPDMDEAVSRLTEAFDQSHQDSMPQAGEGYVRMLGLPGEGGDFLELFADELVDFLNARVGADLKYSDVMVLVRANDDARLLAEKLSLANIRVMTENSLLLLGQPLIEQALAFLRFLDNPSNDVAFMTIITGSIFLEHPDAAGLDMATLSVLPLRKGKMPLYRLFQQEYTAIWDALFKPFYQQSTLLRPYDAVREWFRRLSVEERFPGEKLFLRSFLETLYNAERGGVDNMADFLAHWEDKGANVMAHMPDGIDAVRIMTVHKAKGLAGNVVFVPVTTRAQNVKTRLDSNIIPRKFAGVPMLVGLVKAYGDEYNKKLIDEAVELMDVLYVAFTRARNELHILVQSPGKDKISLMEHMAEQAGLPFPYERGQLPRPELAAPVKMEPESGAVETPVPSWDSFGDDMPWLSRLRIARSELFSLASAAKRRGTFMHFCLENMRFNGNPEDDAARALDFGLSHSGIVVPEKDVPEILKSLVWYVSQPATRYWLEHGWPEQPFLDAEGREYRADLLVREPWGILVLDYKTGDFSDKNVEQIQNYLACLHRQSGKECLGVLVYLDKRMFQVVGLDKIGQPQTACPAFSGDHA